MAVDGLLISIQERAATRGMSLAALARASGMQPSNLRRMLKSTTASPHLGSVMRLLAPLRCRIGPAGATDPVELAAFLDDRRQRRGLAWEQLLEPGDVHGAKLAAVMMPNPERLPSPSLPSGRPSLSPLRPPRLGRYRDAPPEPVSDLHSRPDSPLEIHVDGEPHAFRHVRSGPVFGELEVRGRVYLVAAVSALLVVIEGRDDAARVVWGGRPEKLKEVMVEMGSSTDEIEVEAVSSAEPPPALIELRVQLATAARGITEPDTARDADERAPTERRPLEDELAAERSARRIAETELAGEREARQTAAGALVATRTALEQEVEARTATEHLAAETIGKLMALLAERTQELATESERRAAAESRATKAEQASDALAAENAEALRMIEAFKVEHQRGMDEQRTRLDALHSEIAAIRGLIPAAAPATQSADRPPAKRARDLSKKWRR